MDTYAHAKGKALLVLAVLLLLLFLNSCSHTEQGADPALLYSPTYTELVTSPLSLQSNATGYGREYEVLGTEQFTTSNRGPAHGFELGPAGSFPAERGDTWITGTHPGGQMYIDFYKTNPAELSLKPNGRYEVSYNYKVLEATREGFETIFFSQTGANRNDWVEQSIYFNEPAGSTGRASFTATLKQYDDYQLLMNLISNGSIAVSDIQIKDLDSGLVVAHENGQNMVHTHSPMLNSEGAFSIVPSPSGYSLQTHGFARFWTNTQMVQIPSNTNIILDFDYKVLDNPKKEEQLGWFKVYSVSKPHLQRSAIAIPGYQVQEGHYSGAVKTGADNDIYILEVAFNQEVKLQISNLQLSKQVTVAQSLDQHLSDARFPRLGNNFTTYGEWVAHDGSGSAQGPTPLISLFDLEKQLALSDIVTGLSSFYLYNDPALSKRLKAINPNIVLLPSAQTHTIGLAKDMRNIAYHPLLTAEQMYAQGISKDWFLTTSKGEVINDNEEWAQIPLNVSAFCPYNDKGQTFLQYWTETILDQRLKDGTWEGVFLEEPITVGNWRIPGMFDKKRVDADYNRNMKKDETPLWITEMTAAATLAMVRTIREQVGWDEMIMCGNELNPAIAPFTNGATIANFNAAWYRDFDQDKFNESQWGKFLDSYEAVESLYHAPSAIILEGTPVYKDWALPSDKREAAQPDMAFHRFALGTALLTDAFYEFALVDGRSAPFLFDEMLVDSQGWSTTDAANKGWLGKALGKREHLVLNKEEVYQQTKPIILGNRSTKYLKLYEGSNKSADSRQMLIEFDWNILTTCTGSPTVSFAVNDDWMGNYDLSSNLAGSSGSSSYHVTVKGRGSVMYHLNVPRFGSVELSNLRISFADCGVYRRDFEHGIVLVNASNEEKTISLNEIKGGLNRSNIRRIRGRYDTQTNSGTPITGSLVLAPHDAIVLLAD